MRRDKAEPQRIKERIRAIRIWNKSQSGRRGRRLDHLFWLKLHNQISEEELQELESINK